MTILESLLQLMKDSYLPVPGTGSSPKPAALQQLQPSIFDAENAILRGEITDLRQHLVTIRLLSGESFSARTESVLPLAIGDVADFIVASKDGSLVTLKLAAKVSEVEPPREVTYKKPVGVNSKNPGVTVKEDSPVTARSPEKEQLPPGVNIIPVDLPEDKGEGEIYVYRRENREGQNETDSLYLHFDLSGIGKTDILVTLTHKALSVSVSVTDDKAKKAFEEELPVFSERLSSKGYSVTTDLFVNEKGNGPLLKKYLEAHSQNVSKRLNFDIRV